MSSKDPEKDCCGACWGWTCQIMVIGGVGCLVAGLVTGEYAICAGFGVTYLIYIISMLCSSTFSYLRHKKSGNGIYNKMKDLFSTAPVITFTAQCYHYETRHYTVNNNGKREHRTERVRVNTHYDRMDMPYYSTKDVSGLFLLDVDRANIAAKTYIKLHLGKCIDFADAISYADYIAIKTDFWRRNRFRDR